MRKIEVKINEVYNYIAEYVGKNDFPPSVREICSKLNIKSTATAYYYIEKLMDRGLLEKSPSKNRAITLPQRAQSFKTIPIIGTINAGSPIFAVENLEGYCPIPDQLNTGGTDFALKVNGDSMINAGIFDNDIIIVKQQNYAINGQIVVALIEDSATVKRFYLKNGFQRNPDMITMYRLLTDKTI